MVSYWLLLIPAALFGWSAFLSAVGIAIQAADRNEPVGPTAPLMALGTREAVARVALLVLGVFAFGQPRPLPSRGAPDPRVLPVLLVGGITWNRASLWALGLFLSRRGRTWVHAIDRRARQGALASEAEWLAREVDTLRAKTGSLRVDIVAFSTGGLVAAWYLRHHGAGNVRRLVTIGTPWKGTRMAVFGRGRAVEEIRFGSHVLDDLLPVPVPTTCIFSDEDTVVVPASSAVPDHGADVVKVEHCGHAEMLLSARVFRAVRTALDQPVPEVDADGARPRGAPGATFVDQTPAPYLGDTIVPVSRIFVGEVVEAASQADAEGAQNAGQADPASDPDV